MTKYITYSRKATPWPEGSMTVLQLYLTDVNLRNYYNKHPVLKESKATVTEADVFNSFALNECRYCSQKNITKYGFTSKGIRKYYCKTCKKYFSVTTNTIFDNHKLPLSEWVDFCIGVFSNISFSGISKLNRNSPATTSYWVDKLALLLRNYQENIVLENKIQIDETYYKIVKGDVIQIKGKELRGLSTNQICIAVGCDNKNIYCKVEKLGKPSSKSTLEVFYKHVKRGSKIIHDGDKSHHDLIKEMELISTVYKAKDLKNLTDDENPLNLINQVCKRLKDFLNAHKGFNREDIQGLIDLFVFIDNTPCEYLKKIDLLIKYAINNRVLLRFS